MDKRWYPVAFSAFMVSCGGDTDSGSPSATGGQPNYFYGPMIITGGNVPIDTGTPGSTGGRASVYYGVPIGGQTGGATAINTGTPMQSGGMWAVTYGVMVQTGGSPADGGTAAQGGGTSVNTGTPAATGGRFPVIVYGPQSVVPSPGDR